MEILTLKADRAGGHYAIQAVPARGERDIMLWTSYDSKPIEIIRAHVANYENNANVILQIADNVLSMVPSYTNKDVAIAGLDKIKIINSGNKSINVMFADAKMRGIANDVYASLSVAGVESSYTIVNNFELNSLSDLSNEGLEEEVTYSTLSGLKLSANSVFGNRAIYFSDTTGNDSSGLKISKTDLFDMSQDWTLSMWLYGAPSSDRTILRIGGAGVANSVTISQRSAFDSGAQFTLNLFGTETHAIAHNLASSYKHFALSKIGTKLRLFTNGTQIGVDYTLSSTAKLSDLYVGYCGINSASYKNYDGYIDALSFLSGIGLYTINFTPPSSAPI